ncbi:hypothetical protein IL306_010986 [Fusarium sp. DS 682]|nr:hypothetical protein IL306_010986 [Fusarium sp. DS 682]
MPSRKLKEGERRRCANACYTCKRRKERCDGRQPCGRCVTRGVDAECSFVPSSTPTRNTRNVRLEYMDPTLREPSQDHSQGPVSPGASSSIEVLDQAQPQLNSRLRHDLDRGHSDPCAASPQLSQLIQDGHGKFVFIGDAANLSFLQIIRRLVRDSVGPCAFTEDALQHLMVEVKPSSTSNWIIDIMGDRPARPEVEMARYLLSWYLRSTSCVLNLFEEGELGQSLTSWYQTSPDEPEDKVSAAVFFLIFAIGAQTCPENRDQEAEQYFNYGRFLTTSSLMDDISISSVQSNVLITMYLLSASRRNAAFMYLGSAVRAAYALGIQRHDINKNFKQSDYLLRERLWKVLRVLDLFMSASLGRPPSTHETRDTGLDENYSASNDLCAIFEDILTNIYSQRKVTTNDLERISEHHRKWANKFALGLVTDSIKPSKFLDTADGQETPNIGLCHLKEAYYWTIMLLSRPSLTQSTSKYMSKATKDLSQCEPPSVATEPNQVLAFSCVDSAVRTADLLQVIGGNRQIPKRLPFVVNSLFIAALVLGMAYFSDLDHIFPLDKSLLAVRSLMARFSTHDPIAKSTLQTIDNLQTACKIYVDERARRKMERQSLLVRNLFGTVHDGSRPQTPTPQNKATGPRSMSFVDCSEFGQIEQVLNTWTLAQSVGDLEGEITSIIPHEALEAFSLPTPTTIAFESFGTSFPLFSTVDVCSLDVEGTLAADNLPFGI